jgi:hypothetical protein
MLAYSVSNVVSENIFKNKNRADFLKLIAYTFFWGIIIYTFITFGSFGMYFFIQLLSIECLSGRMLKQLRTILSKGDGR